MKSPIVKRSIVIAGHKTSVSLEDGFWNGLKEIADGRETTLSKLVGAIDSERHQGNLSSAIRLLVLEHYRGHPGEEKPDNASLMNGMIKSPQSAPVPEKSARAV